MVTPSSTILSTPQRQPVLGLVVNFVGWLRSSGGIFALVLGGFFFRGQRSWWVYLLILFQLGSAISAMISWWTFRFWVADGNLHVEKGLISKSRQATPLDRIQSVSIERSAAHRVVGLVKASLETAGSDADNVQFEALRTDTATALQLVVEGADDGVSSVDAADEPAARHIDEVVVDQPLRNLLYGAAARAPFVGLVGLSSLVLFVGQWLPFVQPTDWSLSTFGLVAVGVGCLVLVWSISIGEGLIRNWSLQVTRSQAGLRRSSGLVSTTSSSTAISRVQGLKIRQNPIERRWGVRRVTLRTIGSGDLKIAGASVAELHRLREIILDSGEGCKPTQKVSLWVFYRQLRSIAALLVGAVGAAYIWSMWLLLAVPVLVVVAVLAFGDQRQFHWDIVDGRVVVERSFLFVRRVEQRLSKVQSVVVERSLLERRRGLATLVLVSVEGKTRIPMIKLGTATRYRDEVLMVLETDHSPWM